MHFKIFLQQLRRGGRRTALYVLLLAAVTAFFIMSVNLYRNSVANLSAVENNFSTIAVMELYGNVDMYGDLAEPYSEEHIGYKSVAVAGYDFSDIVSSDGVIGWDLRSKYGAYIEDHVAFEDERYPMADADVIRFRITGDNPIELPINWDYREFFDTIMRLEVLDSAAGCFQYETTFRFQQIAMYWDGYKDAYAEQVKRLNRSDEIEKVILYPGVEYIVTNTTTNGWVPSEEPGVFEYYGAGSVEDDPIFSPIFPDVGETDHVLSYQYAFESSTSSFGMEGGQPFPIQRWEDVQNDPEMKAYFDFVWDATAIQHRAYTVALTNDITGVSAYHLGGASLKEGRLITKEEYESGAKVCMISDRMAEYQGWQIGDKLDMQLFEFPAFTNNNEMTGDDQPIWSRDTEGFFYEGEYEIVGIYTQNEITGNSGIARSTLAMPWYIIYIPEKAVDNTPPAEELPVHGALLTIRLENGSIDRFLSDMETLGLAEETVGQYNPTFTFFDQGYSLVQPGLEAMHGTARLLLVLSSVLLIVTCVLLAFFFAQNQKQSVGIFRMLGGTKVKALSAVLLSALVVAAAGAALGALAGYGLTQTVGAGIMADNLAKSEGTAALQAFVLESGKSEQALAAQADLNLTTASAGTAMILPILMIMLFVLLYIHKEPRALLPRGEG